MLARSIITFHPRKTAYLSVVETMACIYLHVIHISPLAAVAATDVMWFPLWFVNFYDWLVVRPRFLISFPFSLVCPRRCTDVHVWVGIRLWISVHGNVQYIEKPEEIPPQIYCTHTVGVRQCAFRFHLHFIHNFIDFFFGRRCVVSLLSESVDSFRLY